MLLTEFEDSDEGEEGSFADVRVACLSATPGAGRSWRKVHAQVALLSRPGKQAKVIGTTRVDPRLENEVADFVSSKIGYSVRSSVKARPGLTMWKYSESLPAVPSFSFRVENFTVLKETILVVTLFSARNLIAADANGLSDPFAKIYVRDALTGSVAGDSLRSTVRPKTLDPTWNERFVLGEKKAVVASNILVLNFFDSDVIATSNDPLGDVEIDLAQLTELFSRDPEASNLPQEERAFRGRKWVPLSPPKGGGSKLRKLGPGDFGSACLHVEWMTVDKKIPQSGTSIAADSNEDDIDETPVDSWTHCGAQIAVDLFDQKDIFLGRTLFPIGAVVASDEARVQPQADLTCKLMPRFDGAKDDVRIQEEMTLGSVNLRVMVSLPDPKAKERRMAMLEAKRADRSNVFKKMTMITKQLEKVQGQLAAVNARAERAKNLFNWTQPRRTKLMFNLFVFLIILFALIPSRFFILMIVLFFFTEKFRPMGTMGARFKHLLSQLPTDDDLRDVVKSDAITGKRKALSNGTTKIASSSGIRTPISPGPGQRKLTQSLRASTAGEEGKRSLSKKAFLSLLQNVCAGDAVFSGHLAFCKVSSGGASPSRRSDQFTRRFFIVSAVGMHYWAGRDAMEDSKPLGHITAIKTVRDSDLPEIPHCERTNVLFVVSCEEESFVFVASSSLKKHAWMAAIRDNAAQE